MVSFEQLRGSFRGEIVTPEGADYDKARLAWNLSIDHHPALVVYPLGADDVVAAVNFARESGLPVAVQSTGHGAHVPADGALLIVTSRMDGFAIDPAARTVRAESGVVWEPLLAAAEAHGLAPLVGTSPHVGIVGYTLGGGIGWMARKFGLGADSVRAVELVTADGVLRRASADENPDLFWGLRGGRGSLGVVTALTLELYPFASLYAGGLTYGGDLTREGLRFFRDWTRTLPDEMTAKLAVMKFPDLPYFPEAIRGKTIFNVRAAYTGDAESGAALVQPWLDWHPPRENTFAQIPVTATPSINQDPVNPGAGYPTSALIHDLSDDLLEIIARRATDSASPVIMTEIRHAGGAIARLNRESSAIGNRDAEYYLLVGTNLLTPQTRAAMRAEVDSLKAEIAPHVRGVYLNYLIGDEARDRAAEAFVPGGYARMQALKSQYDPDNLFSFGFGFTSMPQLAKPA